MTPRPALVFDLDGTLLDSAADIMASVFHTFELHGHPRPHYDRMRPLIGRPLSEIYAAAGLESHHHDTFIGSYRAHYKDHCADTTVPFPGVLELLTRLRKRGYLLVVATAKRGFVADEVCAKVGLTPYVDAVQGTDDTMAHKPSPDVVLAALEHLKFKHGPVQGLWMVGDTSSDMGAGQAAGLKTYGVTWGTHKREILEGAGADFVGNTLDGLLELLEEGVLSGKW